MVTTQFAVCACGSCFAASRFTGKERDSESGNDYFGARYYASTMGRFLSPDPLLNSGHPSDPQSWNRYSYASNTPLVLTDPTGMYDVGACNADADTCKNMAQKLKDDYWSVVNARFKAIEAGDMDAAVALGKSLDNLGAPGEKNSSGETVTINIDQGIASGGQTTGSGTPNVTINLSPSAFHDYENGADVLAHEGAHAGQNTSATFFNGSGRDKPHQRSWYFDMEWKPYRTQSFFDQYSPIHPDAHYDTINTNRWGTAWLWDSSWSKADIMSMRSLGVWSAAHQSADMDCKGDAKCK